MPFSLDLAGPGSSALTPLFLLMLFVILVLGGTVKRALGVGLPFVVVPLLSLVLPSPTASALVVVPVLASNS